MVFYDQPIKALGHSRIESLPLPCRGGVSGVFVGAGI
jgi:hypothetical protein